MTTYMALLRAVNLGGHNKIGMSELLGLGEGLGFRDSRTLLNSGNLVFRSEIPTATRLEGLLEERARKKLGLATDFFVRSTGEWGKIIAGNPFPREAERDPGHLVVMFLKNAPDRQAVSDLQKAIVGREVVRARGREAYIVYPDGIGRSRLTGALLDKKLGTSCTGRNWNTVLKLDALAASLEGSPGRS